MIFKTFGNKFKLKNILIFIIFILLQKEIILHVHDEILFYIRFLTTDIPHYLSPGAENQPRSILLLLYISSIIFYILIYRLNSEKIFLIFPKIFESYISNKKNIFSLKKVFIFVIVSVLLGFFCSFIFTKLGSLLSEQNEPNYALEKISKEIRYCLSNKSSNSNNCFIFISRGVFIILTQHKHFYFYPVVLYYLLIILNLFSLIISKASSLLKYKMYLNTFSIVLFYILFSIVSFGACIIPFSILQFTTCIVTKNFCPADRHPYVQLDNKEDSFYIRRSTSYKGEYSLEQNTKNMNNFFCDTERRMREKQCKVEFNANFEDIKKNMNLENFVDKKVRVKANFEDMSFNIEDIGNKSKHFVHIPLQ